MTRTRPTPSLAELSAEAAYARDRVMLHRRRVTLGKGDPVRLASLERAAEGARVRLAEARGAVARDA